VLLELDRRPGFLEALGSLRLWNVQYDSDATEDFEIMRVSKTYWLPGRGAQYLDLRGMATQVEASPVRSHNPQEYVI